MNNNDYLISVTSQQRNQALDALAVYIAKTQELTAKIEEIEKRNIDLINKALESPTISADVVSILTG